MTQSLLRAACIKGRPKHIKEMAAFYVSRPSMWARQPEAWLDASKKRWPDATQRERILAHRLAKAMISNSGKKTFGVVARS